MFCVIFAKTRSGVISWISGINLLHSQQNDPSHISDMFILEAPTAQRFLDHGHHHPVDRQRVQQFEDAWQIIDLWEQTETFNCTNVLWRVLIVWAPALILPCLACLEPYILLPLLNCVVMAKASQSLPQIENNVVRRTSAVKVVKLLFVS